MPYKLFFGSPSFGPPSATGNPVLPFLQSSGDATAEPFATGTPLLPNLVALAAGEIPIQATGEATLSQLVAAASGTQGVTGTAATNLLTLLASGAALSVDKVASGTPVLPNLVVAANALHFQVGAAGSPSLPKVVASGVAAVQNIATGSPVLQQLVAFAKGTPYTSVRRRIGIIFVAPSPYGVYVHEPWWPYKRIADLTRNSSNIRRTYVRMAVGHATLDLPKLDPDDHTIHQGNILVIVARDQPTWAGPIYILNDSLSGGVTTIEAADMASVLAKRTAGQAERYSSPFGSSYVVKSLINSMNARGHTGILASTTYLGGPSIDDLFVGGQTILQALEELHNRTNWEWWIENEATPGYVKSTLRWAQRQGRDLSTTSHLWHGIHFNEASLRHDLSEGKQLSTVIGGFGKPIWERTAVSQASAIGQRHDISGFLQQLAPELIVRTASELPASLRDERVQIDVTTESAAELARNSERDQQRRLAAETVIRFMATNMDRTPLQVGNYITIHVPIGHHRDFIGAIRLTAVQPDEELDLTECVAEARI